MLLCKQGEIMDNKKYIERIKNLREDHDYTQEYVANYLGTSQTMYARYERRCQRIANPPSSIPVQIVSCFLRLYTWTEQ